MSSQKPTDQLPEAIEDVELPVGEHPFQLYSLATPNGVKVTVLLEELLAAGFNEAEYDAWLIRIGDGDQFGSGFVEINPNSKIPALMDRSGETPVRVFESGAILLHLAEKFGAFLPKDPSLRPEMLSWLFWQMGSAPYLGGGFGHFYAYAPFKMEYPIDRFAMETKRQLDVLDRALADRQFIAGSEYTIADIAIWAWYGQLVLGRLYGAAEFLNVDRLRECREMGEVDRCPARCSTRPHGQSHIRRSGKCNCTNDTTPQISRPRHRTNWRPPPNNGCFYSFSKLMMTSPTRTPARVMYARLSNRSSDRSHIQSSKENRVVVPSPSGRSMV